MRYVIFLTLLACMAATVVHADVGGILGPPIIAHDEQIPFVMRGQSSSVFFLKDSVVVVMKESTDAPATKNEAGWYKGPGADLIQPAVKEFLANRRIPTENKASDKEKITTVRVNFVGANPNARIEGIGEVPGSANRLIGRQASAWTKGISTYSAVTYRDLWPGIDLTFGRADGAAQCSIRVAAGSDPGRIRLRYEGTGSFTPGDNGAIVCKIGDCTFSDNILAAAQPSGTTEKGVNCRLVSDGRAVSVRVEGLDASQPTTLSWASGILAKAFLDGWKLEPGQTVASDKSRTRYITGSVFVPAIPKAWGGSTVAGGTYDDGFAAKLDASGKLAYFTILGGNGFDRGNAVAIEDGGAVYLLGDTTSKDFPVTSPDPGPANDDKLWCFSAKLSSSGDSLTHSTYLGAKPEYKSLPQGKDRMIAIVVDDANSTEGDRRYLKLGIPLTFAAFPEAKQEGLEEAKKAGSAVFLHVRMEALTFDTGKGIIHHGMGQDEIKQQLEKWLAKVPGAVGINNHMGSRSTSDPEVMRAVLQVAAQRKLIFLDSKTAPTSVCCTMAESMGVPAFQQDLFLDGSEKVPMTTALVRALADMTARTGYGIGICHAGRTAGIDALAKVIPEIQAQGIRFVTLAELAEAYGH